MTGRRGVRRDDRVSVHGGGRLRPLRRESTADLIARRIRDGIQRGVFPPGTQLRDGELAAQFGVSRGPLREALQRLVQEGLVHSHPYRGLFVITLERDDIVDVYLIRRAIERAAVEVLLQREPNGIIATLEELLEQMDAASRRDVWSDLVDLDLAFHRSLVEAARSERLRRIQDGILVQTRMCLSLLEPAYRRRWVDLVAEHVGLVEALRDRDEERALRLLNAHLDDAVQRLTRVAEPEPN